MTPQAKSLLPQPCPSPRVCAPALQSYRPLESFSREVLMEYIRRGCWFPSELERIEGELGSENGKATSVSERCSVEAPDVRLRELAPVWTRDAMREDGCEPPVDLGEGRSLVGATMPEHDNGRL